MSGSADVAAEWARVIGVTDDPGLVTTTEKVVGRLVLQEHTVAGVDSLFAQRNFEVMDVAETAILEPQVRVYEELVIRVQCSERDEVVSGVLRREQAEITTTGKVGGAVAGPSRMKVYADEALADDPSNAGTEG